MPNLIVVDDIKAWPDSLAGAPVIAARQYLSDVEFTRQRGLRVFNLCKSYRYQHNGYYVSLLATARGHRPLPDVATMQDLKSRSIPKYIAGDLDDLIQKSLQSLESDQFDLSIYFGMNMAKRHERLARAIFNMVPAPLLRAKFRRHEKWQLESLSAVPVGQVADSHREFLLEAIKIHFSKRERSRKPNIPGGYDLAILASETEKSPPSDGVALRKFARAARNNGFNVEFISSDDYGRIAEFDALFIRDTTGVNHYTYRFARRAELEGLVVIDDPVSIIRCTNKVYLAELMQRLKIRTPKTMIVSRENQHEVGETLGFPCVLKQPDSSFSVGVTRAKTQEELDLALKALFERSDLVIAQAFLPTDFDWRVGIIDKQALYACRYFMVSGHWQIYQRKKGGSVSSGKYETLAIDDVPDEVLKTALRAANAIGDGFYGVDLKTQGKNCYIVEVNDNPSIDSGVEDKILGDELYERIIGVLRKRVETRKRGKTNG